MFTKLMAIVGLIMPFLIALVLVSCQKKENKNNEITNYKNMTIDEAGNVISKIHKGSTIEEVSAHFGISKKEFMGVPSGRRGELSLKLVFDNFWCIFTFDDIGERGKTSKYALRKVILTGGYKEPPNVELLPERRNVY